MRRLGLLACGGLLTSLVPLACENELGELAWEERGISSRLQRTEFECIPWDEQPCPFQGAPEIEAHFSGPSVEAAEPEGGEALLRHFVDLILAVPPSGTIHAATYSLRDSDYAPQILDALTCAASRGTNVFVATGRHDLSDAATELESAGISVVRCSGSCVHNTRLEPAFPEEAPAPLGSTHQKLIVASEVCDGASAEPRPHVVHVSSANWDGFGRDNAGVTVRGDADLHSAFLDYVERMQASESAAAEFFAQSGLDSCDPDPSAAPDEACLAEMTFSGRRIEGSLAAAYLTPSPRNPFDVIFDRIDCSTDPLGEPGRLRISQSFWSETQSGLVDRLGELAQEGCAIELILREDTGIVTGQWQNLIRLWGDHACPMGADGAPGCLAARQLSSRDTHQKFLLVDAKLDESNQRRQVVFSGTTNFTDTSASDDTVLEIETASVYDAFSSHFAIQWDRAAAKLACDELPHEPSTEEIAFCVAQERALYMNEEFCSASLPCGYGEGDCDGSEACEAGLFCVEAGEIDVCLPTEDDTNRFVTRAEYCSKSAPCTVGEGDCDSDEDCVEGVSCAQLEGIDYCISRTTEQYYSDYGWPPPYVFGEAYLEDRCQTSPCGPGEGPCSCADNCDASPDCLPGLRCVKMNAFDELSGEGTDLDLCLPPGSGAYCTGKQPCAPGHGDCDNDDECETGAICVESGLVDLCQVASTDAPD